MAIVLFLISLATRMWRLEEPRSIVFDELHYGKYASLYMRRTFFFDSHPPLGKQLIALMGYLSGYDGSYHFDQIGKGYAPLVPIWAFRCIPALCGSLLVPTVYQIIIEMGLKHFTGILAALLIIFDTALLTQSRFILMEGLLLFFTSFSLLCLLKFRKLQHSIKYVAVWSLLLIIGVVVRDYWSLVSNPLLSNFQLALHFIIRFFNLFIFPLFLYIIVFYIHLSILTKAGPHDNVMTSAFQASLEGGLASITKGQPLDIVHGSQITLRHTHGRACWLHSHPHVYPIRYPDNRGSSHQQQVTCYSFKDVHNWWIVKRLSKNDLVVSEPLDKIKHGDIIQLVHGISSRALNSHDVAAPMSPRNQEVSCYIDYNVSMPAQNLWRDIVNRESEGDVWHTIQSQVRLIHVNSTQALKFTGKQLPDWGFHQHEVVTDRVINQESTIWNVEEHRYTKNADRKDRERELGLAEFVPTAPTHLSFWEKLWELQFKMFLVNQENVQDHMYSSGPFEWPFLTRGIAYWVSQESNAQIHLIGNLVIWYSASISICLYVFLLVIYLLRRHRKCFDIPADIWFKFIKSGEIFLAGYMLHYVPYFFADRTLFLHHYLPAFLFNLLLMAAMIDHLYTVVSWLFASPHYTNLFKVAVAIWVLSIIYVYTKFSVLSYGVIPLNAQEVFDLKWKESWDFIIHKP
uniref:Protein O-mannosyltransferase 1 n=1 Tax=Strigamia maritima TaxID=126957 RepID=T1JMV6_STRMM